MFQCFLCSLNNLVYKDLLKHLKNIHNLRENSVYKCVEINCSRTYSSKDSYINHLKKYHINEENSELKNQNSELYINSENFGTDSSFTANSAEDIIFDGININCTVLNDFFFLNFIINSLFIFLQVYSMKLLTKIKLLQMTQMTLNAF